MTSTARPITSTVFLLLATPAWAEFHEWDISEIYSNSDGTVQYIELTSSLSGQEFLSGHTLVAEDSGGNQTTFSFPSDLNGSTANQRLLLATSAFASLTGLTPDYVIPAGFVPRDGGSLNFGESSSVVSFSREQLPRNGIQSLSGNGLPGAATPTNFSGLAATPPAQAYATFDASSNVLNLPVLDVPSVGIANVSFTVDLNSAQFTLRDDFFLYGQGIEAGSSAASLQGAQLHVPGLLIGSELYEFNMQLLGENPIVFGNIEILSVTSQAPEPEPEPEPEPNNELQQSIARGETQYANQCGSCHGVSGGGGIGPSLVSSGFNTFAALRSQIDSNMPETNPAQCRDTDSSSCATDVANYVLNVFQGSSSLSSLSSSPAIDYEP